MTSQTATIDIQRNTAAIAPAMEPYRSEGRAFSPAQLAIVGTALDAGIFYQRDFEAACRPKWEAMQPVVDHCLTAGESANWVTMVYGQDGWSQHQHYKRQLEAAPRGTWAILGRPFGDGSERVTYTVMIADGNGHVDQPQTSDLDGEPAHQVMVDRMVAMEIYRARLAETSRREQIVSQQRILASGWSVGTRLRNVSLGLTRYSSATIVRLSDASVSLELTKRGSAKRYTWTGLAQLIAMSDSKAAPIVGQLRLYEEAQAA